MMHPSMFSPVLSEGQSSSQPGACQAMMSENGSMCMPMMFVYGVMPSQYAFNQMNGNGAFTPNSDWNSSANGRRQRRAKPTPASDDALTSQEIDQLRLAVQNKLGEMHTSGPAKCLPPLRRDFTFGSSNRSAKAKECDSDTLSTSSSTCVPESRNECWADVVEDDTISDIACSTVNVANEQVFSDAFVDHMLSELECANSSRQKTAMEWVIHSTWPLSVTRRGCRIVQRAMELAAPADQTRLVDCLEGRVLEALQSPHANYVLQKCFEIASPDQLQDLLKELKGHVIKVARHRFGCRILQRAMENCTREQTNDLIAEVLADASQLIRHTYGNFVIQHILQYGTADQSHEIAKVLLTDALRFAKHRIASHVMSRAVSLCSPDDVENLTKALAEKEGQLADLSRRHSGSFVVREINRVGSRWQDVAKTIDDVAMKCQTDHVVLQ